MMPFEKQPPAALDSTSQSLLAQQTPLHYACYRGDLQMVQSLLQTAMSYNTDEKAFSACIGAMIEEEDAINGWTPAHWAAFYGQLECLMKLHVRPSIGFDKSTQGSSTTPLHLAAQTGAILCLKWLLQCGATINRQDFMGETALHKAAKAGNTDSAAMLISHGSALELKNHRGCTPADLAQLGNHPGVAGLIRRHRHQHTHTHPHPSAWPISDLSSAHHPHTSPLSPHTAPFPKVSSLDLVNPPVFPGCHQGMKTFGDGWGCVGMDIRPNCPSSLNDGGRSDFETSSESLSSHSTGLERDNGKSGVLSLCRMKRSLDLVEDEEGMWEEEEEGWTLPDNKRRCFVPSQGQEKYGTPHNNNIISSYNAILAINLTPCSPGLNHPASPTNPPSSSAMEHQQSVVAEQGYDCSIRNSFNVFV